MQLFLDLIRRLLMAILTVLLAQLGMSIEAEMPRQGREVQRTPECTMALSEPPAQKEPGC